jgi:RNA polymerase sigma factor (sigma-70 family)
VSETQFLEQVRENQGIIYKLVGLYASDAEEKKDLYQEVLLQAWKAWPNFRRDAKFSTWLYRICLNTILTQKRKARPVDYKDSLEAISPSVQHSSIQNEATAGLQKAMRRLSETDRAIISLHFDGYDNSEISEILGITGNHVAVKLHRCKQQLTNLLKQ